MKTVRKSKVKEQYKTTSALGNPEYSGYHDSYGNYHKAEDMPSPVYPGPGYTLHNTCVVLQGNFSFRFFWTWRKK